MLVYWKDVDKLFQTISLQAMLMQYVYIFNGESVHYYCSLLTPTDAVNFVQDNIHKQQTAHLEAALRVTCDLNHSN